MDPAAGWVFGVGLLVLGAAVQYVKRLVGEDGFGRNAAIGIRTRATMASDEAWRRGHAAAVPLLRATYLTAYGAGAVSLATGVVLLAADTRSAAALVVPLCGLVAVLGLLIAASARANGAARAPL
ncbi:hypothetical protein GCM10010329_07730 [Streptomyces spiroverticillatus]|uniref:SdpI family protein n=1 Tax=Streptomyces finlayi TaxID=67296 RepID=A0A919C7Y6_9ACTN|nr:SdpI family protein [Streptomyces finlayi]GGZ89752.1 hypothetical protein GCM10010329_07730 [Streptomyces spiroverticillatus]GHC80577.1 hypothetical protein GCM10010334_07720 [Streptomyces finlayi]